MNNPTNDTPLRKILVTSALPYANGPIHLGHLVEYIQTDIWVRAMKALGHDVKYVCADDAHGTAIMMKAQDNGVSPEEQIATVQASHEEDFASFLIEFDNYYSTHSLENQELASQIYNTLNEQGLIFTKYVEQLFDTQKGLFLADRFVKGDCPKCGAKNQYGDNCEVCGTTYNATELKNPRSTLSNSTPVIKKSKHYFFDLPKLHSFLQTWTAQEGRLQAPVINKLNEWFQSGLKPWDISRDAPYFGFKIPNTPSDEPEKYFYVWLDAPVGYMASFQNLCQKNQLNFDEYFNKDSQTELYHFIGKDIVYFHTLFWPAMLHGANYRTPTAIHAHGFLTVNGEKMSKSRGTFINAKSYLNHLNPEYLRYYFASKLSNTVEDINLDLNDFMQKVNSDLIGKVINIASRTAGFVHKYNDGKLADSLSEKQLLQEIIDAGDDIANAYENREFSHAMRLIMNCADKANEYIDHKKPWALNKIDGKGSEIIDICTVALNIFRQLIVYLSPVLPSLSEKARQFLNIQSLSFDSRHDVLLAHTIHHFNPLMSRVEKEKIDAMLHDAKDSLAGALNDDQSTNAQTKKSKQTAQNQSKNEWIDIHDFNKIQMKVAKVLACNAITGADKLLQFSLDVGEEKPRNVFSGVAKFYRPEELTGKTVICVTNLAPRKMKFGTSEGMILSAEKDGQLNVVLLPDSMPAGALLT